MSKDSETIDWTNAMVQVGGDEEFLQEVLRDLLNESNTADEDIGRALAANHFEDVAKAAHRIKGSASYLCCNDLREAARQLQDAGHEAHCDGDDPKHAVHIAKLYEAYQKCLGQLKDAINKRF